MEYCDHNNVMVRVMMVRVMTVMVTMRVMMVTYQTLPGSGICC